MATAINKIKAQCQHDRAAYEDLGATVKGHIVRKNGSQHGGSAPSIDRRYIHTHHHVVFLIVEVAVLSPLADAISRCPFRPRRGLRLRRSPVGSDASTSRAEPTERAARRFRAGRIW